MWDNPSRGAPNRLRKKVLRRDGNRCVQCGSSERLEVDHILNVAQGGTNHPSNLQTLCVGCHREKSQGEALRARVAKQKRRQLPVEQHPGVL